MLPNRSQIVTFDKRIYNFHVFFSDFLCSLRHIRYICRKLIINLKKRYDMKLQHYWLAGLSSVVLIAATSCVDNDYDLSDIDTTARLQVKELVVPMNIEEAILDQVLDLDDDSEVKKIELEDGSFIYAVKKDGSFNSDPIHISEFTASKPNITPIVSTLDLVDLRTAAEYVPGGITAYYDIKTDPTEIKSEASDIDKSIYTVKKLDVATRIVTTLKVKGLSTNVLNTMKIENLKVKYPAGMSATTDKGNYDPQTGYLTFSQPLAPNSQGEIKVKMTITALDASSPNIQFDGKAHTFKFEDNITVEQGRVNIYADTSLPDQVTFTVTPDMEAIKIDKFTGSIVYDVGDIDIDPIDISNLPDLINQEGTSISIADPQLYLTLSNPLEEYIADGDVMNLGAGISLKSEREGASKVFALDESRFSTAQDNTGYTYVLAPKSPQKPIEGYINPQWVKFSSLSNVLDLDGKGIPTKIYVDIAEPRIDETNIESLKLGVDLPAVEGNYTFYAPLQLNDGSVIKYVDTIDDWSDEDLDKMTITKLNVDFVGSTEVPFELKLKVLPINKTGKPISGVTSNTVTIPALAKGTPVNVTIEGEIKELDGIQIEANIVNKGSDTTLAPSMKLIIKDFKAKVSGYYEDEL